MLKKYSFKKLIQLFSIMFYKQLQIFMFSCIISFSCATKPKTYKIVEVTLIEDRDGREHMFDRTLVEGKAVWCHSHEQYELVEVKRLQNQANLIKARAND